MTEQTYQGWDNYETWVAHLWMTNEEGTYNTCMEMARLARKASEDRVDVLIDLVEQLRSFFTDDAPNLQGLYADLLTHAIGKINWWEIANAFIESVEEADESST